MASAVVPGSFHKKIDKSGLTVLSSATAMLPGNKVGISLYIGGGSGTYFYNVASGGGVKNPLGAIVTLPGYDYVSNPFVVVEIKDTAGNQTSQTYIVGQAIDLVVSILLKQMQLSQDQIILWNQGVITYPDIAEFFVVVSNPSSTVLSQVTRYSERRGEYKSVQTCLMLDIIHVDLISKNRQAMLRKMDPLLSLTSQYSLNQQNDNSISINLTQRDVMNTIDLQPSFSPYRYRHAFAVSWSFERVSDINYYDVLSDVTIKGES